MTKDPAIRREDVVGRPRTRDRTLAGPWGVARMRRRSWNRRQMIRWGRNAINAKGTKDLEALGRLITKKSEEGLPGNGRRRMGLMFNASLSNSGLPIPQLKFHSTGTIGLWAGRRKGHVSDVYAVHWSQHDLEQQIYLRDQGPCQRDYVSAKPDSPHGPSKSGQRTGESCSKTQKEEGS